ncbi:Protease HtpX [subsurface metagenome]
MRNYTKTFMLMAALTILFVLIGNYFGGRSGAIMALIFAAIMNLGAYFFSDKIVLAMYKAKILTREQAPQLYQMVDKLRRNAGLPMPKIAVIPTRVPNAFATGRNPQNAVVAVTQGITEILKRDELEGVIGHELGHVRNRDILTMTIAATMAGAISMISRIGAYGGFSSRDEEGGYSRGNILLALVGPLAAMLIQMAISRAREYEADKAGAQISGKPEALASALGKLSEFAKRMPLRVNPSTAHLFIVNPLKGGGLMTLFSTHPPVKERMKRLLDIARQIGKIQ